MPELRLRCFKLIEKIMTQAQGYIGDITGKPKILNSKITILGAVTGLGEVPIRVDFLIQTGDM